MDDGLTEIPADDRINILAVDDRPEKLLALEAMLSDMPVNIIRAGSGRDALRWMLRQEFALVLLDVDMPAMDGFETAQLIRQRKATEHLPIIFVTAYHDEMYISRGYSLGAVDYILQPVVPEILRSKVSVFVDLFRKNRLVERQVKWQRERASQLQKLAQAAIEINAAASLSRMLQLIAEHAREIIQAHQSIVLHRADPSAPTPDHASSFASFSEKYMEWRGRVIQLDPCAHSLVASSPRPTRLTTAQLHAHPDWDIVRNLDLPPILGVLAAPLLRRDGRNLGVIYLSDKIDGSFTADDEAILVQLSQMGAVAIENLCSAEAREANRAKDQFIAVLSHELRTPLAPVLGMLAAIQKDHALTPALHADLEVIRHNVLLEARLIDDLLDITRITKGKIELHAQPLDVHDLLRETVRICQGDIDEKNISLTTSFQARHPFAIADPTRLKQVFWNLLKNSTKFTPAGGQIAISTANTPAGLRIEFQDDGMGIAPDILPRIFTPFEQGDTSVTRQFGGLGLGLAISKALIDKHQGRLEAHSPGTHQGAIFTVTLPITDVPPAPRKSPHAPAAAKSAVGRILLVEDHRDTGIVMKRVLQQAGYSVDLASSVKEALALAVQSPYQLLISDIGLPDGTGLELMRKLQTRAPILGIALSGFGMEDDIKRSRDAGFSDHVTKPVDSQILLEKLQRLASIAAAENHPLPENSLLATPA